MKSKIFRFLRRIIGTEQLLKTQTEIRNFQLFRGAIQDCEWLKYKSFSAGGWAMDNAALYTLFRILNDVKPENILEFGLGQSSKMVHQYATFTENVNALTIEHDNEWINFFCNGIQKDVNLNIRQFDMEMIKFNGHETLSYKNIDVITYVGGGGGYDLVIVDGPFGSDHYSRSQVINLVPQGLSGMFCIFMDDSNRKGEMETISEICKKLNNEKIKYCIQHYDGEKINHTIICSENLRFLTTLR